MRSNIGRQRLIASVVLGLTFAAQPVIASDVQTPSLTTEQVVSRLVAMDAQRAAMAPGYRATRHYALDYKGFPGDRHAEMLVQVVSAPPHKEFAIISESGSKLLLKRVLHRLLESEQEASDKNNQREIKLNQDNYTFELLGTESVDGRDCYLLQAEPRKKNKFLYSGKVWIDAQDFAVVQINAKPAKNPSFWISSVQIEHRYGKHGDAWLPRSNRSTSKVRLGGRAVLTIDYQDYEFTGQNAQGLPLR